MNSQRAKTAPVLNQRFGRLVAVQEIGNVDGHGTMWKCVCDCKQVHYTQRTALVQGRTRSCGCLRRELSRLGLAAKKAKGLC